MAVGGNYTLNLIDVDSNKLSTADGHITVIVVTTSADFEKARLVGDRVPEFCLGDPAYRMVTIVNFQKRRSAPMRLFFAAVMRRRLDAEAKRLQPRYAAKKLARDPRRDVYAVADFDGTIVSRLGMSFESGVLRVFVFGRSGELLQQWNDVPSAADLASVVK